MSILFLILIALPSLTPAQQKTGTIEGIVIDIDTKAPLIGANILITGTLIGASSDAGGRFSINNIPVGAYNIKFSYIGYETLIKTDVIVKSDRSTQIYEALKSSPFQTNEVNVTSGYFTDRNEQAVSAINFSYEEIRRAPGSAGDVSRIIMGLPGIAKVNDQTNNLIVRGGSPAENAFYVDNIEIPNINHFPTQGASGGPIGLLNVDFINDVNFYSGGFPVMYGNKLSSVMDISFREGSEYNFEGQLDLNFSGFGGVGEGPIGTKGSWMLSIRRSYLDLLVNTINIGTSVVPRYGDYQGKIVYNINPNNKIILLGISGDDHNNPDAETAVKNDMITYGNQDIYENTFGINLRTLWNSIGYSNTSLSYTSSIFNEDSYETGRGLLVRKNRSREQAVKLRNVNRLKFNEINSLVFGIDIKHLFNKYNNIYPQNTDVFGNLMKEMSNIKNISADEAGAFADYIFRPVARLTLTGGLRADYFSFNSSVNFSPRISLSYKLTGQTTLNGSYGVYYQNTPLIILSQNPSNADLKSPGAVHYILGVEHLLSETTKLTVEIYKKDYFNFPSDPSQPDLFLMDELYYGYGFYVNHNSLNSGGIAQSRGIELTVQKKLAKDFYGLASASYSSSRYKGQNGEWINRIYDNRFIFGIEGGYKPDNNWEFSLRWIFAGGVPYTPFDLQKSGLLDKGVLDETKVNTARYPDYHSLNLRVDKRFNFTATNLIIYISIWNAYNRKNVANYFWNESKNLQGTIYQWGILPIFGVEYEF